MKHGQKARILYGCHRGTVANMHGYRAMCEYYSFDTLAIRIDNEAKLKEAFEDRSPFALTLLLCHGWGKTESDAVVNWEIMRQINQVEWEEAEFHWTKDNIREHIKTGSGILLNTGCWSAKDMWANAFLDAGFEWYIAPEKTSDCFSAYQFLSAMLGYLLYEVRDSAARVVTVPEAVALARRIDDLWDGAAGFKVYGRDRHVQLST